MDEVVENELLPKAICVGHFLLCSFSRNPKDFVITCKLMIELCEKDHVALEDIQEGIMVILANFYDALIDTPNCLTQLKEMLESFEKAKIVDKEFVSSVQAHVEEMKKQLEEEYGE